MLPALSARLCALCASVSVCSLAFFCVRFYSFAFLCSFVSLCSFACPSVSVCVHACSLCVCLCMCMWVCECVHVCMCVLVHFPSQCVNLSGYLFQDISYFISSVISLMLNNFSASLATSNKAMRASNVSNEMEII